MSLTKRSVAGNKNYIIIPGKWRIWLVTSRLGTEKSLTFFLQCTIELWWHAHGSRKCMHSNYTQRTFTSIRYEVGREEVIYHNVTSNLTKSLERWTLCYRSCTLAWYWSHCVRCRCTSTHTCKFLHLFQASIVHYRTGLSVGPGSTDTHSPWGGGGGGMHKKPGLSTARGDTGS
jgi:hypothetical protein